jgi:hypothetical protein
MTAAMTAFINEIAQSPIYVLNDKYSVEKLIEKAKTILESPQNSD